MNRLIALLDHFAYNPKVIREGTVHDISFADLTHAGDKDWDVKLILYPNPDPTLCPGALEEAVGYIEGLKKQHIDYSGLIEKGYAVSVSTLEKDPYKS